MNNSSSTLFARSLITVFVIAISLAACSKQDDTQVVRHKTDISHIETLVVGSNNEPASIQYDGSLEAVIDAHIAPQISGRIVEFNISAGDVVSKDQVLVRIDDRAAGSQVAASKAQIAALETQLELSKSELLRQQKLFAKNYISNAALERAQAQVNGLNAQLKALQAQSRSTQSQYDFYTIRAPFAGVIENLNAVQGDMAMPGQPLLSIYQADQLRAVVDIPQQLAAQLDTSQKNAFKVSVPALASELMITKVELLPTANARTYTQTLRLYVEGANKITKGMSVKVSLPTLSNATDTSASKTTHTSDAMKHLLIPKTAVIRHGDLRGVYVVSNKQVLLRQVRLGRASDGMIEILAGIDSGEVILRNAQEASQLPAPSVTSNSTPSH